ncbi:MAG: UDP-3-O-(3-hydroxymyristoyl)glucosamine N-acyltransferase [Pseudomonadota bacterium]|nr:UDP-3-O-(3-hydroxymyristoyl)glucosamine N-acyltransferase [Pseudomonadota bacterium]
MADPRFFRVSGPFTLGHLAGVAGASLVRPADADLMIYDVSPLAQAGAGHISFLDNRKYVADFRSSRAAACLVHSDMAGQEPAGMALLLTPSPYRAYARVAQVFYPLSRAAAGVSPAATVHPSVTLGEGTEIAAGAVVEEGVVLGRDCRVGPNAVIGRSVSLGDGCVVGACASVSHAIVGNRVHIYPGARIGQDGFGFAMDAQGHVKVPQLGRVIIEDDVEIGANSTIDRGSGPDTVIGRGTMIDNLVQIGHNVTIGPGCVLVAQAGVSGSTVLGAHVLLAGQAGVAGHLKIGPGARVAAKSGVMEDIPAGKDVCGTPAMEKRQFFRQIAVLKKLAHTGRSSNGYADTGKDQPD